MATVMILEAENDCLCLDVADNGWCRCACEGDTRIVLGAEAQSFVFPRLAKAVAANLETAGLGSRTPALGYDAYYVMMLPDLRQALYAADSNGSRVLLWIDAKADPPKLTAQLRLNDYQRQKWLNRLVTVVETSAPAQDESNY